MSSVLSTLGTRPSLLGKLRDPSDRAAWELFVRTYGPPVYQFCHRRGVQEADAVDLVQEVLTQVVVSIRSFEYDPARGRFRDWLGAVARSKLARHWRAVTRPGVASTAIDPDQLAGPGVDAEWAGELDAHLLHLALGRIRDGFDPSNWRAFELTWLGGRPAAEVAAVVGVPVAQVYVAKSRIAKRLEEEVRFLSDDVPHLGGRP